MAEKQTTGERIRQARTSRQMSLSDVAGRAGISVATLSRIERDKQSLGLGLFLLLLNVLEATPEELMGTAPVDPVDPLAVRISALNHQERIGLWRELAEQRAAARARSRNVGEEMEELLAQIEYLQAEMESVRTATKRR